jgi:hypothetical protein
MVSNKSVCRTNEFGSKVWRLNDKLHREDGPACEWADGSKELWLNYKKLDPETAVNNPELQLKYPRLIESMLVYLIHDS